jgi:patatin-like phospholipase/acyl hydrolase
VVSQGLPTITPAPERRWILALSGGGYRGLFTAQFLARLEAELGRPLHTVFDLMAGTSIGSILALGLARGLPAQELVEFFRREGEGIFPKATLWRRARQLFRSKYSAAALTGALETAFVRSSFATLNTQVIVPAVGLTDSGPVIFRSRNGALPASIESLHDAALASSAAPTYFPPHTIGEQHYVDGGLIANSPDALALIEATAVLGWPLRTLHLLSVGTTAIETGLPYQPHTARWGILRWGWKLRLLEQLMAAQAKLSRQSARTSLGSRFVHVDAIRGEAQDRMIALDRASEIATNTLFALADTAWQRFREHEGAALESLKLRRR